MARCMPASISPKERHIVARQRIEWRRDFPGRGLIKNRCSFVVAAEAFVSVGEILICETIIRVQPHAFKSIRHCLLVLAGRGISERQVVPWDRVPGISLLPLLIDRDALVYFPRHLAVIMSGYVELFPLARPVLEIEGLGQVFSLLGGLRHVAVNHAQGGIRHGKIRIQFDGALQIRNCFLVFQFLVLCLPQSEGLQCFQ